MKIRIAKNWFDNNLSGEEGYTFNETSEIYTKTITEDELNLEFSPEGEFEKISVKLKLFFSTCIFRYNSYLRCTSGNNRIPNWWHFIHKVSLTSKHFQYNLSPSNFLLKFRLPIYFIGIEIIEKYPNLFLLQILIKLLILFQLFKQRDHFSMPLFKIDKCWWVSVRESWCSTWSW